MRQTRRFFAYTAALPLFATFLWMAIPGCSGENALVAEGDPVAHRKQKEEHEQNVEPDRRAGAGRQG